MNREIRFRVWDPDNKEFFISEDIVTSFVRRNTNMYTNGLVGLQGQLVFNNQQFYIYGKKVIATPSVVKDFVVQQFTGIEDKNDKDVYDGDIITITDDVEGREPCSPTHEETSEPMEVYWDIEWNGWKARRVPSYNKDIFETRGLPRKYENDKLEILGNILEHSKLVKKVFQR